MRHIPRLMLAVLLGSVLANAARAQDPKDKPPLKEPPPTPKVLQLPPAPPLCGAGMIFVINDVGEYERLSNNVGQTLMFSRAPLGMDVTLWSSFDGRLKDHQASQRRVHIAGCLTNKILHFRKAHPLARAVILAHGDGCHIGLLAAEMLPPKTVDRIILLGPSVSSMYDLRPALLATRDGIDNFFSPEDSRLERLSDLGGSADRKKFVPLAGWLGFCKPPPQFPGAELYLKLRQYKYDPDRGETFGIAGWHHSWIRKRFLDAYILPLVYATEPVIVAPPPPTMKK